MAVRKVKKPNNELQMALFAPESSWEPPTDLPDLSQAKFIGVDVEAKDPNLMALGPGYLRGDAQPVGISLAVECGPKLYLPFGHLAGGNMDKTKVVDYVRVQLSRPEQVKVGANLMYECEALDSLGIEIKGELWDIQNAEPLLDEAKPDGYSLEQLSKDYLGEGKTERLLRQAAAEHGIDPKTDLWKMHSKYVGEYGSDDALKPLLIMKKQLARLEDEKLMDVFKIETELLPALWLMRKRGVRVDLDAAEALSKEIQGSENELIRKITDAVGFFVDPWKSKSLEACFTQLGLQHLLRYTDKVNKKTGDLNLSFKNDMFTEIKDEHPVISDIVEYRQMNKMRRDFVEGVILQHNVKGRLHPNWHQLRADDEDRENGTKTGRIASSKVNLTQIPVRSPIWGKRIRRLFVADYGGRWCKLDYSQQEPRWLLDFAYFKDFRGSAGARQMYLNDPHIDYHEMVRKLIEDVTGIDIGRFRAKTINLGSAYGMGKWKLAKQLGVEVDMAKTLLQAYHQGVPYVKKLGDYCMELVQHNGFIRTWSGRKRRFTEWEALAYDQRTFPCKSYEEAVSRWGDVTRAYAHKAMNAKVQGSAADQIKIAIIWMHREGLTPHIQVYDEINTTIYEDAQARRIQHIMEHACELSVPFVADPDVGPSWGEVEELA